MWSNGKAIHSDPQCPTAFLPPPVDLKSKWTAFIAPEMEVFSVTIVTVTLQPYFSQRCIWNQIPRQQTQICGCINIHKAWFLPRLNRMALNVISSEKIWMEFLYIFTYRRRITWLVAFLLLTKRSEQQHKNMNKKEKSVKEYTEFPSKFFTQQSIIKLYIYDVDLYAIRNGPITFC
jgi:hypothetical protein